MPRTLVATLGLGLAFVGLLVVSAAAEQQQPSVFGTLPFVDERFQGPQVCMSRSKSTCATVHCICKRQYAIRSISRSVPLAA